MGEKTIAGYDVMAELAEVGGYQVPVDPMDDNECESCQ